MTDAEKIEAMDLIDSLCAGKGASVKIISDHADFGRRYDSLIEIEAIQTEFIPRRIHGPTLIDCLRKAVARFDHS